MKSIDIGLHTPLECTIVQRLNRFVVQVEIDGTSSQACINNTGRLGELLLPGKRGFCSKNQNPLKTVYRLFAIREGDYGAIIDTQLQMKAFEKALEMGLIPWLEGSTILKRNVRLGDSVIDYFLACREKNVYLEVKSAALREKHYAMYPDCPTTRGRRHIRELIRYRERGGAAVILFMAALPGVEAFKPSRDGDPEVSDLLIKARQAGVDIRAMALFYHPGDFLFYLYHPDLPVEL